MFLVTEELQLAATSPVEPASMRAPVVLWVRFAGHHAFVSTTYKVWSMYYISQQRSGTIRPRWLEFGCASRCIQCIAVYSWCNLVSLLTRRVTAVATRWKLIVLLARAQWMFSFGPLALATYSVTGNRPAGNLPTTGTYATKATDRRCKRG